jgi:hypothetical protein
MRVCIRGGVPGLRAPVRVLKVGPTSGGTSQIRVLAVDDHPLVREGIAGLVGVQPDVTKLELRGDLEDPSIHDASGCNQCGACAIGSPAGGTTLSGESRPSNPPERVWRTGHSGTNPRPRRIDSRTAGDCVKNRHSVARAPGVRKFDMSGTQPGSRLAPAVLALCTVAVLLVSSCPRGVPGCRGR